MMKRSGFVTTIKSALVFIAACAVIFGTCRSAMAQTGRPTTASTENGKEFQRAQGVFDGPENLVFLGFFPRNSWLPVDVRAQNGEGLFTLSHGIESGLEMCVPSETGRSALDMRIGDLFPAWRTHDSNVPRWLEPVLAFLDALCEQVFGVRPFEGYLAKVEGGSFDMLDLQLPFGLQLELPRGAFKEEL